MLQVASLVGTSAKRKAGTAKGHMITALQHRDLMIFSPCMSCKGLLQNILKVWRTTGGAVAHGSPLFRRRNHTQLEVSLNHKRHLRISSQVRNLGATNNTAPNRRVFVPSAEQLAVVELCSLENVVVSARPGAGKTATAEAIVAADPTRPIAVLTYSKRLQLDTAHRLSQYPESNVFTFHALAGKLYSTTVPNDATLRALRRKRHVPIWTGKPYEIIVLDELQDCTDDLFWLICTFIKAVTIACQGKAPRIVVLGDERQAIYAFKGADSRYLSLASSTMTALSPYPWNQLALNKSFRLSYENTDFVNKAFLGGEEYIVGSHSGPRPIYLHTDTFEVASLAQHLVPLIRQYSPERTAILAPSVRQSKPVQMLTNYLSEMLDMLVAQPQSDDGSLDENVLRGKICVSTYHQFKGNERDLVIAYGVDAGYFAFHAKDLPDDVCPNATFVALTRAYKQLVVIHNNSHEPMPFVNVAELQKTANVIYLGDEEELLEPGTPGRPLQLGLQLPTSVLVSELPRHIPDEIIEDICTKHLQINQILPPLPNVLHLNAPLIVLTNPTKKHYEAVSDLNGLAVVAAYEYTLLGNLTTLGTHRSSFPKDLSSPRALAIWLCREACNYEAKVSGYRSRRLQMKNHPFDWLASYLDEARSRLEEQFSDPATLDFEVRLKEEKFSVPNPAGGKAQTISVHGRADIIRFEQAPTTSKKSKKKRKARKKSSKDVESSDMSIWEIKFVAKLSLQHAIQVCIYAYLWCNAHSREIPPRIHLFNVRDGEKWEIVPKNGLASLRAVLEEALVAKYTVQEVLSTDEFLDKCEKTVHEVEKKYKEVDA